MGFGLTAAWRDPRFEDITFVFPGGETLACDRFLLACRSSVFRAMLYGHMSEAIAITPEIHITDASPEVFKQLLHFIYTDSIVQPASVALLHQLRLISRKYLFTRLQTMCETLIWKKLSPENAGTVCFEAYRNGDSELVTMCLQFIAGSFAEAPASEIAKLPLECMTLLVKADETSADELTVFQACLAWAQSRSADVKSEMQCLLPLIRFQNMTHAQIAQHVVPARLIDPGLMMEILTAGLCGNISKNERCHLDSIFLLGGGQPGLGSRFGSVYELHQRTETWCSLPSLGEARSHAKACVCRGVLYCLGGDDENGSLQSVESLDLSTRNKWVTVAPLPSKRSSFAACSAQGKVYAMGGLGIYGAVYSSAIRYDPDTNQWASIRGMEEARFSCSAAVIDGKIYVTGGQSGYHRKLTSVVCYNPATDAWSFIEPMISGRSDHCSCAFRGKLFVFGGDDAAPAECYDPNTGRWTQLAPMPENRTYCGCTVSGSSITLYGGYLANVHLGTCLRYQPDSDTWVPTSLKLPQAAFGLAMCETPSS